MISNFTDVHIAKILILADGNSVHTERWVQGLLEADIKSLHLLNMNPIGVRNGLKKILRESQICTISPNSSSVMGRNWRYFINTFKVRRHIQEVAPDVIVAFYLTSYGFMAALVKGRLLLVQYMMGSDVMIAPYMAWYYRLITLFALFRADLYISSSQTIYNHLRLIYKPKEDSVLVQQYGLEDWVLNFPEREKQYTFISNRAWIKNSNILLVLELFLSSGPNSTLALAGGSGVKEINIDLEVLNTNKIYLPEFLSDEEMIELVARSEYFFSLTNSDGASLSLMEAMAVGSIPIASNIPPNMEWITDGVNGFLIDLNNIDTAKAQIRRAMMLTEDEKNNIRLINKSVIKEKGSRHKNMNRFISKLGNTIKLKKSC